MADSSTSSQLAPLSGQALASSLTVGRGIMGAGASLDSELATCQRIILQAAASGIDMATNAELRARLDMMALDMVRRGYPRDVRAAGRYFARMRQLDISAAKAITEARRDDRAQHGNQAEPHMLSLSDIKAIMERARQADPSLSDGTLKALPMTDPS